MRKSHKTRKIPIKWAEVDVGMIPIVNFFNYHEGVETLFCCQGSKQNKPYVSFQANNEECLLNFLISLERTKIISTWLDGVEICIADEKLNYIIRLESDLDRKRWINCINNKRRSNVF